MLLLLLLLAEMNEIGTKRKPTELKQWKPGSLKRLILWTDHYPINLKKEKWDIS